MYWEEKVEKNIFMTLEEAGNFENRIYKHAQKEKL